jgi:hypothetical protein
MHTLKTIVATGVVTLAATTVAFAGVNGLGDKSSAAGTPVKAIAAHQQTRVTSASTQAAAKVKRQQHVARHQNEVREARSAQHAYTAADSAPVRAQTRAANCVSSGDEACDQTREQTRDRTCDQTCDRTREHARDGSGECGGGCGD